MLWSDAEGQVLQNALHAAVVLLPSGAQVLLQSRAMGGKMAWAASLGSITLPEGFLLLPQPGGVDVDEGLLHCDHQPGKR